MSSNEGLQRLRKALVKCSSNTDLMVHKLNSFDSRLDTMENKLKPLQQDTEKLILAKENISNTLLEVGKTYEYFRVASEVKDLVYAPYSKDKEKDIFAALDNLSKAKQFFEDHREMRSASALLHTIGTSLDRLVANCVDELSNHIKPVGSVVVVKKVTDVSGTINMNDKESPSTGLKGKTDGIDEEYNMINPMSEQVNRHISTLVSMLDRIQVEEHMEIYHDIRNEQIQADLSKQIKKRESDWKRLGSDDSPFHVRSNSNPLDRYLTFCRELLKGELHLWASNFLQTPKSLQMFISLCNVIVEHITEQIERYTILDNRQQIVGDSNNKAGKSSSNLIDDEHVHLNNVYLVRIDLLDTLLYYYDTLYEACKPDFRRDSEANNKLKAVRDHLIENCVIGLKTLLDSTKFVPLYNPDVTPSIAETKTTNAGTKKDKNMVLFSAANAGQVCDLQPITTDTLHCCGELLAMDHDFLNKLKGLSTSLRIDIPMEIHNKDGLVSSILEGLYTNITERGDGIAAAASVISSTMISKSKNASISRKEDNTKKKSITDGGGGSFGLFGAVTSRKLDESTKTHALYDTGAEEAAIAIMSACKYLFLANNFSKLDDFLSEMKEQLDNNLSNKTWLSRYRLTVTQSVSEALSAFCKVVTTVMAMQTSDTTDFQSKYNAIPISDKQGRGRLVKAKFSMFNSGLNALLENQGAWRVSSPPLREKLGRMLSEAVTPQYEAFHNEYHKSNFSKRHLDQYIKFSPDEVRMLLLRFWGAN